MNQNHRDLTLKFKKITRKTIWNRRMSQISTETSLLMNWFKKRGTCLNLSFQQKVVLRKEDCATQLGNYWHAKIFTRKRNFFWMERFLNRYNLLPDSRFKEIIYTLLLLNKIRAHYAKWRYSATFTWLTDKFQIQYYKILYGWVILSERIYNKIGLSNFGLKFVAIF